MNSGTRTLAGCFVSLALVFAAIAANADDHDERYAMLFAPRDVIGPRLENWAEYFGTGYTLDETQAFPNPHTKQPMVGLLISHGETSATFVINLVTNEHFLVQVSSASGAFLEKMGIRQPPPGSEKPRTIVDNWDMGVNELTITRKPDGALSAEWIYYLD